MVYSGEGDESEETMSDWLERRFEELQETNRQHLAEIEQLRAEVATQKLEIESLCECLLEREYVTPEPEEGD